MTTKYPLGITDRDLEYPKSASRERLSLKHGEYGRVTLYQIRGRAGDVYWAVCTLWISRSRRGTTDRTYAIRTDDGTVCRIGAGPHVLQEITVYIRENRVADLAELLRLYDEGSVAAHQIRDRIGSRRAEGQLRRAAGESSWYWGR
jgi:hypothetical protein